MSRERGDNLPERRWSLIKWQDWIVSSSIFSTIRFLLRLNTLSTITCKIMLNSLYKEIPVNSLKKSSSDFCFLNVPGQILLFLVGASGILRKWNFERIPKIYNLSRFLYQKKVSLKILYLGGSGPFVRTFSEIWKMVMVF